MEQKFDQLFISFTNKDPANIHFLDIENLVGSGLCTPAAVNYVCEKYWKCVECTPNDLFVISAGPQNRKAIFSGWSHGRKIVKLQKGKDGADEALKLICSQVQDLGNFSHLYLGSGDHGLAAIAKTANKQNIPLTVVTGYGAMSEVFKNYDHIQLEGIKK